jgi:hypothetical protein
MDYLAEGCRAAGELDLAELSADSHTNDTPATKASIPETTMPTQSRLVISQAKPPQKAPPTAPTRNRKDINRISKGMAGKSNVMLMA